MPMPRKPLAKVEGRKKLNGSGLTVQWRGTPGADDWALFIATGGKRQILADRTSETRVKALVRGLASLPRAHVRRFAKG
jgi:hypothetical protein